MSSPAHRSNDLSQKPYERYQRFAACSCCNRSRCNFQQRYGFVRAWSSAGSQRAVQIVRRANHGEMGESLGEVSQGLAAMPGLFRIEADMVGKAEHPLENQSRFLEPRPVVATGSG